MAGLGFSKRDGKKNLGKKKKKPKSKDTGAQFFYNLV